MSDWMERAKRLGVRSVAPPSIDKEALAKKVSDQAAATAARLEEQSTFSHEISRGVVSSTLMVLSQAMDEQLVKPVIEEHHKRMISVRADINGAPVVVNILSLLNGQVRLTSFCGADGIECGQNFALTATNEEISGWLGSCLVNFFETAR
jgi:hypothetical protein